MQDQIKTMLSIFEHGSQTIVYILDQRIKTVGMTILPTELKDLFSLERKWNVDSLVQLKLVGDGYASDYSQGHIMHGSESSSLLKYDRQEVVEAEGERRIETVLQSDRVTAYHVLRLRANVPGLFVETRIENTSGEIQRLEYLTSFSLCDLSPVGEEERIGDLFFYRLTSRWSGEDKLLRQPMLDLHMEPSWSRHGVNAIRYGQVGSMPVRSYFPWGVVEDEKYGWCMGAQLIIQVHGKWRFGTKTIRFLLRAGWQIENSGIF